MFAEFGAWYPRFSTWDMHVPWDRYKRDVNELLDMRLRAYSANVLWRAYGPTHFGGPHRHLHRQAAAPLLHQAEAGFRPFLHCVPAPLCLPPARLKAMFGCG